MRRYLLLFAFLTLPFFGAGQEVKWLKFEKAIVLNEKEPRPFLVDFYTVWCGPCRMMNKRTFGDPIIAEYINEHFYPIKFNAEGKDSVKLSGQIFINPDYDPKRSRSRNGTHQLTRAMASVNGRIAYPTVVYLNERMEIITPIQGYIQAAEMEPILHFIAEEAYADQEYQAFRATFKGSF